MAPEERGSPWVVPPSAHARATTPARAPLPIDLHDCPPLDQRFRATLDAALDAAGIVPGAAAQAGIDAHVRLLVAWTAAINLTAIREPAAIALEHVADALSALPHLRSLGLPSRPALLDIGSGGGYPGLPLGLALPAGRVALVESVAKKARFLDVAGRAAMAAMLAAGAEPPAIEILHARVEELGQDPARRGRWDLVTARAVAVLAVLVELAMPLLARGGLLVAWKRDAGDGSLDAEIAAAGSVLAATGGELEAVARTGMGGRLEDHRLVVVRAGVAPRALGPAPAGIPRQWAERWRRRCG